MPSLNTIFSNKSCHHFHTTLNSSNSITEMIHNKTVQCLIDTGANINVSNEFTVFNQKYGEL